MSISRIVLAVTGGLVLAQGLATASLAECQEPGKTHRLKFKVKADECVETVRKEDDSDAETITVCVSDKVVWQVTGPAKSVVFEGDSPFDWADSGFRGSKIEGTVREGTEGQEFKYSVMVDGLSCVLDPRMIVEK